MRITEEKYFFSLNDNGYMNLMRGFNVVWLYLKKQLCTRFWKTKPVYFWNLYKGKIEKNPDTL